LVVASWTETFEAFVEARILASSLESTAVGGLEFFAFCHCRTRLRGRLLGQPRLAEAASCVLYCARQKWLRYYPVIINYSAPPTGAVGDQSVGDANAQAGTIQ